MPNISNPAAELRAYIKRLEGEYNPIVKIPANKRSAFQKKRLPNLQSALNIARHQLNQLNAPQGGGIPPFSPPSPPAADPWAGLGFTNEQIIGITNSLTQMGYTKPADIATLSSKYMTGWQNYELNKAKYATWWKQIYGTDLPQFGFENNPFAVAAAVGAGNFMGYDLARLTNQANALEGLSQGYTALGQAGSWQGGVDQLGFEQFRELAGMFGATTPTQSEFAQLKAPSSTFKFQGADWSDWSTRYEDWRKKRQTLYSPEEGKVSYQQGEEGFTAPGLKPRQQY